MKSLRRFICITVAFLITIIFFQKFVLAQSEGNSWVNTLTNKSFIENKGQYGLYQSDEKVLFTYEDGPTRIHFTKKGVRYSFLKRWYNQETDEQRLERRIRKFSAKTWKEREAQKLKMNIETDVVSFDWVNANTKVQVIGVDETNDYHNYTIRKKDGTEENINFIKGYKKVIYKNLYPNIDIEFEFHPVDGIKYAVILHPGANNSRVLMEYSRDVDIDNGGNLLIKTKFGDIIEHAPVSFYSETNDFIKSEFIKEGNVISFNLSSYDKTKKITIDPWVQTPTLANSNGVWECERDASGNVYIIGGCMPMKLLKYNAAGTLQWTYNTPWDTANFWLGTFATDLMGNSFVTAGSVANLRKINTSGTQVWTSGSTIGSSNEYWNIAFNCDQTKLIVGGTKGNMTQLEGAIFDINTSNGSINSSVVVGWGNMFGIPPTINEVRSITSSRNARYYFLTLDTIGCLEENFTSCPSAPPTLFRINSTYNLAYKCENYRPNNGNSGIMAIRANRYFVYTQNGTQIQCRSLANGGVITSAAIPGGISTSTMGQNQVGNSGIDLDSCGNVYVGSGDRVCKFDENLSPITSVNTQYRVSDVAVSTGGNVIICGTTGTSSSTNRTGYVQSLNMSACDPMSLYCCNANICPAGPFCHNAASAQLIAEQPGGTWSGPGVNPSTGMFDPASAGPGTHFIVYTLPCGSDSISIVVNFCATLVPCVMLNGDISVSGGTAPYTWQQWVPAGTLQITDQASCVACGYTWQALFNQCMNGMIPATSCNSAAHWTTFATGTSIPPPPTTSYPLQVIDAGSNSVTISSYASLQPCSNCPTLTVTTSNIVNIPCDGSITTGSFDVNTSGGTSPYDYVLLSGTTTVASFNDVAGAQSFTGLAAGSYILNVLDNDSCPGTTTITITETIAPTAGTPTVTDATCGQSDGSITVNPSGGTAPYTYIWDTSPPQTTETISNLAAATYTVTITDANSCTVTASISVNNIGGPTLQTTSTNASCGQSNGTATVTATGGSGTYTYEWSSTPPQTTATATGLAAGTYTVTVDDGTCIATAVVIIDDVSTGVSASIINVIADSCSNSVGGATVEVTGGASPYTYSWSSSPAQTTETLTNVPGGTYTVTVTDASSCATTASVTIPSTAGLTAVTSAENEMCGQGNGNATVITTGGSGVYTYLWSNTQATSTISGLSAGTYIVTVSDGTCTTTASATVSNLPGPTAAFNANPNMVTPTDGPIIFTDNSSGNIVEWIWSYGDGTPNGSGSQTSHQYGGLGTYIVTLIVTDINGCSDTTTNEIKVVDEFTIYIPNTFTPDEDGLNDGFSPIGQNVDPDNFEMYIFDRWGDIMYHTTKWGTKTAEEPWNGTKFNEGTRDDIFVGVYAYRINLRQLDGPKHVYIGSVTVIK